MLVKEMVKVMKIFFKNGIKVKELSDLDKEYTAKIVLAYLQTKNKPYTSL